MKSLKFLFKLFVLLLLHTKSYTNIEIEDEIEVEQGNLDAHESRKSKYKITS